jgi:hypothetical protein
MPLGNDKIVYRCMGIDILESHHNIVLIYKFSVRVAVYNITEDTFLLHFVLLPISCYAILLRNVLQTLLTAHP